MLLEKAGKLDAQEKESPPFLQDRKPPEANGCAHCPAHNPGKLKDMAGLCASCRFNDLDLGAVGGLPHLMDMGQRLKRRAHDYGSILVVVNSTLPLQLRKPNMSRRFSNLSARPSAQTR